MTEKQYKLEQWSSLSLYYSFPDGNLHHSIGKVIARVENDLNSLYNENEQLKEDVERCRNNFSVLDEVKCEIAEENELLKQSVNNLKDTIIKITIAYQRKYDRTIVDLVDEVHEENITDLIKELKE